MRSRRLGQGRVIARQRVIFVNEQRRAVRLDRPLQKRDGYAAHKQRARDKALQHFDQLRLAAAHGGRIDDERRRHVAEIVRVRVRRPERRGVALKRIHDDDLPIASDSAVSISAPSTGASQGSMSSNVIGRPGRPSGAAAIEAKLGALCDNDLVEQ